MDLAELVRAITGGEGLVARQWVLEHRDADWSRAPRPELSAHRDLAIAAGLAELFAL